MNLKDSFFSKKHIDIISYIQNLKKLSNPNSQIAFQNYCLL